MSSRSEVFVDPTTGRGLKLYLDPVYLKGDIYIKLRGIIESGGGRITPNKDNASIWIVDPEAPYSLDGWVDEVTVLLAPWLLACVAYGNLLGINEGNWCGFKVEPRNNPSNSTTQRTPAPVDDSRPGSLDRTMPTTYSSLPSSPKETPKQQDKSEHTLDLGRWPSHLKNMAFKIPTASFPPVEAVSIFEAPPLPPPGEWGTIYMSGAKRLFSEAERSWMVEVIEWCMSEYPKMNLTVVCEVLGLLGYHRPANSFYRYISRKLDWFADRAPHLRNRLCEIQSENYGDLNATPVPKPIKVPKPSYYYEQANSPEPEAESSAAPKPFTDADRLDFVRYAAARPTGMEPAPGETAVGVWAAFAEQHPSHPIKSWRTWHQHRRDQLKAEVAEYRAYNMH